MSAFSVINRNTLPRYRCLADIDYDEMNFVYTVIFHFKQKKLKDIKKLHSQDFKKDLTKFNLTSLQFPLIPSDIRKFINRNPHLQLTVALLYCADGKDVYPYGFYGSGRNRMHLLVVSEACEEKDYFHYFYIFPEKLPLFLTKQYRGASGRITVYNGHHCPNCFVRFRSEAKMREHFELCRRHKHQRLSVPELKNFEKPLIKFKNYRNRFELPIVGFADFESALKPVKSMHCSDCSQSECVCSKSFTRETQLHAAICYSLIFVAKTGKVLLEKVYSGEDAVQDFFCTLLSSEEGLKAKMKQSKDPIVLTPKEEEIFCSATHCHICQKIIYPWDVKVRDHDHMTGQFYGAAHQSCNMMRVSCEEIPIFFHNGVKYDFNFIVSQLDGRFRKIDVMAKNTEQFRCVALNCYKLLDSIEHLPASLDELVRDLKKDSRVTYNYLFQWSVLSSLSEEEKQKRKEYVTRKGVYPYEYVTDCQKLFATKSIPEIGDFYSSLNEKGISHEDHDFAKTVFEAFGCSNMLDYTELYCSIDVYLLCEVFMHYRKNTLHIFDLDPCRYFGTPSLAFDIMLTVSKAKLELFTSMEMVDFIRKGIRGGQSFIATKKALGIALDVFC